MSHFLVDSLLESIGLINFGHDELGTTAEGRPV